MKFVKRTGIGMSYFKTTPGDSSGLGILMSLRDTLMEKRMKDLDAGKEGRSDLLQTFLKAQTADGDPLDIEYIKSEVLLILTAGADTTGTTMQGLVHHVLTRPDVKEKLMAEIDEADKKGLLSASPTYEEVSHNLPYYVACVNEVLRLWPPSPALFPRVVGPKGIMFGDKLAPPGVEVTSSALLVQRDKQIYGEDAEYYNPDRWLDPAQAKLYFKYQFAFGYGSRVCLGKDIALMEIYKGPLQVMRPRQFSPLYRRLTTYSQFLRKFDISLRDKDSAGKYTIVGGVSYWKHMHLNVAPRKPVA